MVGLLKLLGRIIFGVDFSTGVLSCLFYSTFIVGHPDLHLILFSILTILILDTDLVIFMFIRWLNKRFGFKVKVQSHRSFFHHPLIALPAVYFLGNYFAGEHFGNLGAINIFLHCVHDTASFTGFTPLSPFSWIRVRIELVGRFGIKVVRVSNKEIDQIYSSLEEKEIGRSIIGGIEVRSRRTEAVTKGKILFFLIAMGLLGLHLAVANF